MYRKIFGFAVAALLFATPAFAQGGLTRLTPISSPVTTLDADTEFVIIESNTNPMSMGTVGIQITGTYTGVITPGCSIDGVNYTSLRVTPTASTTAVTSIEDLTGIWTGSVAGCKYVRAVIAGSPVTGAAIVRLYAVETGGGGSSGGGGGGGDVTITDGVDTALVSAGGELLVSCADCSGSGVSHVDDAVFTVATDDVVPIAGIYRVTLDNVADTEAGALAMRINRILMNSPAGSDGVALFADAAALADNTANPTVGKIAGLNYIYDGATWDRWTGAVTVTSGDIAVTGTVNLSATDNAVLDDIADGIAVTNAGTFATQINGDALTALQLIDNLVQAEDAVASSAFSGVGILAVRQDSQSDLAADGDFIPVTVDADGGLRVSIVAGGGSGGTSVADDADFTDGTTPGTPIGGVAEDASPSTVTEGDFGWAAITLNRALKTALFMPDGTAVSATAPLPTCIVSFSGSACITIPDAVVADFDTDGGDTSNIELVGLALPSASGPVHVDANTPLPVIFTTASTATVVGNVAHDSAASGNPLTVAFTAAAHSTNPSAVTAGDVTRVYASRAGIPFSGITHPNIITREWTVLDSDGNQTGTEIVANSAGTKIVVIFSQVTCDADNTADVDFRMAFDTDGTFAAAATTGTNGIIHSQPGIIAGGGSTVTKESIGADGDDVRYSLDDPAGGACRGVIKYYTIES